MSRALRYLREGPLSSITGCLSADRMASHQTLLRSADFQVDWAAGGQWNLIPKKRMTSRHERIDPSEVWGSKTNPSAGVAIGSLMHPLAYGFRALQRKPTHFRLVSFPAYRRSEGNGQPTGSVV